MSSRFATAKSVTLAIVALLAFAAPASATNVRTTINGYLADITTAAPGTGRDNSIMEHVNSLIVGTPPGARIRVAAHAFGDGTGPAPAAAPLIRQALMDAKNRGVDVKVVHSGQDQNDFTRGLRNHLGPDTHHRWCDHGGGVAGSHACISVATGTMHSKFITFSTTWGNNNVSWFGSANFADGSIVYTHNNTVTVYGDSELYNGLTGIWDTMWQEPQFWNNDFYAPPRGFFKGAGGAIIAYASPEQDTDLVVSRLDAMSTTSCSVYISNWHFNRTLVLDKLLAMKPNCVIRVIAREIDLDVARRLKAAGIEVRVGPTHDKMMLIHSSSTPYRVLTGSQNLTKTGLRYNDELLMQINGSQAVFNAMATHWWNNHAASVPHTG